jgi:uncharacterized protein (DUF697 family)
MQAMKTAAELRAARRAKRELRRARGEPGPTVSDWFKKEITEIEHRTDITDDWKVSKIVHKSCAVCAVIAIQPIPFADNFILTPTQAYFASRISAIRGVPVSESEASDWIKEIVGIVGMGITAQQIAIGVWKTITFGLGGFVTIPLVYGLTYAIMKVSDVYFSAKAKGQRLSDEQIKSTFKSGFEEGEKIAPEDSELSNRGGFIDRVAREFDAFVKGVKEDHKKRIDDGYLF